MTTDRRHFLKLFSAGATWASTPAWAKTAGRRVIVVGGGFGGTIAAKTIRMQDPSIEVLLIEPNKQWVSSPLSNLYVGGLLPDLSTLTIGYDKLAAQHGIQLIHDTVTAIHASKKTVTVAGKTLSYDRLVLSPGLDLRTEEIKGYHPVNTPKVMPHAWTSGAQTLLLRQQLVDMPDGGTVLMSIPLAPMRYPAGAYERASLIAMYLKQHKPKSKIIVLDANPDIVSNDALFKKAWAKHYDGILDYRSGKKVTAINDKTRSVFVEGGEEIAAQVVNLIPPQRAGKIALTSGLTGADKAWCPVQVNTFESTVHKNIHVIGDACNAGAMPKSGFAANSEAKICAINLVALMNGQDTIDMAGINVSFSYVSAKEAISEIALYASQNGQIVATPDAGGMSPDLSEIEAVYATSWLKNILTEMST